jgi:hypothetical protein
MNPPPFTLRFVLDDQLLESIDGPLIPRVGEHVVVGGGVYLIRAITWLFPPGQQPNETTVVELKVDRTRNTIGPPYRF